MILTSQNTLNTGPQDREPLYETGRRFRRSVFSDEKNERSLSIDSIDCNGFRRKSASR